MTKAYHYYDCVFPGPGPAIQILSSLRGLVADKGLDLEYAKFPSGHRVYRIPYGLNPGIEICWGDHDDRSRVYPTEDYGLLDMLGSWERI